MALNMDSITQDGWDILNCLKDMEHIFNDVIITIIKKFHSLEYKFEVFKSF